MILRLIVQTFIWFGAMAILLFLAAGTFAWPGAWVYLVLMILGAPQVLRAKPRFRGQTMNDDHAADRSRAPGSLSGR